MDKVVASELQQLNIFHPGQSGSRKGKAAMDMAIQATIEAQLSLNQGKQAAWALRDIKSTFNYVQKDTVLRLAKLMGHKGLTRYIHWFFQPRQAMITWNGEARGTTTIGAGVPQGSPLSPVTFIIAVAKALEDADKRILREIPTHSVKTYFYVDDFNCTTRENKSRYRGRKPDAITAARKARSIVSEELECNGWFRDREKDEEINFGVNGEAKWVGINFTHDLNWKTHNNRRLNLAEAAWACILRLGTSRGGLSPTAWRHVYTGSIRAIATYSWELGHTDAT